MHAGVGQRCRALLGDEEPPTVLPTMSTRNVPAGPWNVTCMGSIWRKTHGALPRHTANSEHTIGAMERYVQFAWKLTHCHKNTQQTVNTSGAMESYTNASTHRKKIKRSVGVDV
eukprot:scaffold15011_cov61-Phaeocystis_antarctica.AAC.4